MIETLLAPQPLGATAHHGTTDPPDSTPASPGTSATSEIRAIIAAARQEGREHLLETEGLAVVRALGIGVPFHRLVASWQAALDLDLTPFPGDRVVVKVVSPTLLHKTDVNGVAITPKSPGAVADAVRAMERRLADAGLDGDVAGYLVSEFVTHDQGLGGELLLGMRWTEDFGPVVTFGPGGIYAELLAAHLRPGRDTAILSPAFASPEKIAEALAGKVVTPLLTGRLRGQPRRLTHEALVELLERALRFAAAAMPHDVAELEVNPLVPTPRGPVALDALVRLGRGQGTTHADPPRPVDKIRRLLDPATIAVAGVSAKGNNPGRIILRNLLAAGYDPARLFVVKPNRSLIDGCGCVPDVASLPERVDLLVLAIDAAQVPAAVDEAIAHRRAESLIVIPGGLGERSGSEAAAEGLRAALAASRETDWRGPVVNGGNCLGVRSVPGRCNTLFIPEHKLRFPDRPPAPLAILSQSGALAIARAGSLAALNPRYLISFGNQLDLTAGDYLTFLADDPEVQVFACYVEGFRPLDGRRFLEAAERIAARGRQVILYRAGRTPAGARATASHTASIAGDYAVTRELAAAAGVLLADSLEELDDLVRLACLLRTKRVGGWRLGALSNAGFECVALADNLGRFRLPELGAETTRSLAGLFASRRLDAILDVHNPLDVSPILDDAGWETAAQAVLDDRAVDVGLLGCVPLTPALSTLAPGPGHSEDVAQPGAVADRLAGLFARSPKAWAVVIDGGPLYDPLARLLEERGLPVFRTMDRAARAFEKYCGWRLTHPCSS
jgi:acyl-CoA synthetase (NDP forming)